MSKTMAPVALSPEQEAALGVILAGGGDAHLMSSGRWCSKPNGSGILSIPGDTILGLARRGLLGVTPGAWEGAVAYRVTYSGEAWLERAGEPPTWTLSLEAYRWIQAPLRKYRDSWIATYFPLAEEPEAMAYILSGVSPRALLILERLAGEGMTPVALAKELGVTSAAVAFARDKAFRIMQHNVTCRTAPLPLPREVVRPSGAALLSESVETLGFSNRAQNCLRNANICTVGELVARTESQLRKTRGLGNLVMNELREKLALFELSLAGDPTTD